MSIGRGLLVMEWLCMVFAIVLMTVSCTETKTHEKGRVVGGPCNYKSYAGTAEVIRIEKTYAKNQDGKKSADGYDVHFVFHPETALKEKYARIEGSLHTLLLTNGSRPRMGFLKKYGIRTGKTLPCELMVIVEGTCTPMLFKFPTVDLTDYEANR